MILLQANILPDHIYIFPDRNTTASEYLLLTNASPAPVKTGFLSPSINSMFYYSLNKRSCKLQ